MSIYGIDLGTTNSLIGRGEEYLSDLVPSIVDLENRVAGESQRYNYNSKRSFKIDMSMFAEGSVSVACSRYVLEELKNQVKDDVVKDVVISVPAYFTDNQRAATRKAAELAGLNVVSLVNEPTAAALYISRSHKRLIIVFDLGGGTFDVSAIDSRFGNYDVQAKGGCILGGDDFDEAIMRHFIKAGHIPIHKLGKEGINRLRAFCTDMKIKMQKERKSFEVDGTQFQGERFIFTEENYIAIMKLTFAKTITIMNGVIGESIPQGEQFDIALVGGSTRCPYLREWITKEFGKEPLPLDYDPDKVVAQGAAMYADLVKEGNHEVLVSDITDAISVGLYDGTVNTIIMKNSKAPISETTMLWNNIASDKLELSIYQGDSMLAKENEMIGTLVYQYERIMNPLEGKVFVTIDVSSDGIITFSCKELLHDPVVITLKRS